MMIANMTSVSMVSSFRSNHNSNVCACRRTLLSLLVSNSIKNGRPVFSKQTTRLGRLGRWCI